MKKLIPLLLAMAVMLLAGSFFAPAQPQESAKEEKPTFYRLTPGVYVNGWPRFTITYPKDWVEKQPAPHQVFRAWSPGVTQYSSVYVVIGPNPLPLEKLADMVVPLYKNFAQDVSIVSDKSTRLQDGTPAWEVETKMVQNGEPRNYLDVGMKRGDLVIVTGVGSPTGKIEEYQRAIPYSLEFEPGKDRQVKVPPDVQEFFDRHCNDLVSHDLTKFMTHYSDRYLNSGVRKGEMERFWKQYIGLVTSAEVGITEFVPAGDKVYLAGFGATNFGKGMLLETSIIKESGEWKWYGNQRDISP